MTHVRILILSLCTLTSLLLTGCRSGNGSIWDDNKTAGNYKGNARAFWSSDEGGVEELLTSNEEDFVALKEEDLRTQFVDGAIPQPKHSPGEKGSELPSLEAFHSPTGQEAAIFKNVYFNTDDHIIRGKEYIAMIDKISDYLKSHQDIYLFVSGHCDERGPEAYNLSLGARRANSIRSLLVQKGVDPEKIHTVSYGKERPAILGHTQDAWTKNRRGEFRIYKK